MIPKIIHFIWFSDLSSSVEYPEDVNHCMETWKEKLPDYEIMKWSGENFDISNAPEYVQEAYQEKKYAYVSDYVRLWALYNYGGIYLDSDVEILKSLDAFLDQNAFTGFEDDEKISTCIFGSEKGNPIFKEFMSDYEERHFILGEGQYDLTPNPFPITKRLREHGLKQNGQYQVLDCITVYPREFFVPYNPYVSERTFFTENTVANHHFNGSWLKNKNQAEIEYENKVDKYARLFGKNLAKKIVKHMSIIKQNGLCFDIKRYIALKRNTWK